MRQAKIRLVPLGKGTRSMEETTLTLAGPERLFAVQWAADGEGWFVTVGRGNTLGEADLGYLVYVDRKGGASVLARSRRPLYAVPSPDGRHVAFPEMRTPSNVYLVHGL
jgi:hypothetical protein